MEKWLFHCKEINECLMEDYNIESFHEVRCDLKNKKKIKAYMECIKLEKRAVFYAVFRGKMAEGMDFPNSAARSVVAVGIPYINKSDIRVKEKLNYIDKNASKLKFLSDTWYSQDAIRAVNQAIGRLIRNRYDYGAIILIDERYSDLKIRKFLSEWIQNLNCPPINETNCITNIKKFFEMQYLKKDIKQSSSYKESIADQTLMTNLKMFEGLNISEDSEDSRILSSISRDMNSVNGESINNSTINNYQEWTIESKIQMDKKCKAQDLKSRRKNRKEISDVFQSWIFEAIGREKFEEIIDEIMIYENDDNIGPEAMIENAISIYLSLEEEKIQSYLNVFLDNLAKVIKPKDKLN